MSMKLAALLAGAPTKKRTREQILALLPKKDYSDGRTQQCHKDECDIEKIMARFVVNGTISHVNKYQGVYADYSEYDFAEQQKRLNEGIRVFDALPGEVRREFKQNPQAFFNFVNDPANKDDLLEKIPALAKPGTQLPPQRISQGANELAAVAAASEPASETPATPDPAEQ